MAVDASEFRRALQRVCDIFKIPSLYSEQEKCLEALFKGKDIYASLPTGYGKFSLRFLLRGVGGCTQATPAGNRRKK